MTPKETVKSRLSGLAAQVGEPGLTVLLVIEFLTIFILIPISGLRMYGHGSVELIIASLIAAVAVAAITPGRRARMLTAAAIVIGLAANLVRLWQPLSSNALVSLLAAVAFLVILTAVVGGIVFGPGRVTAHRVQGAIVIYLHLALIFAFLYAIALYFMPDAFGSALEMTDLSVGRKILYFSFTTLTTVGYGDIAPVHPLARSLANLEAICGQLYPATLLARVVTLQTGNG